MLHERIFRMDYTTICICLYFITGLIGLLIGFYLGFSLYSSSYGKRIKHKNKKWIDKRVKTHTKRKKRKIHKPKSGIMQGYEEQHTEQKREKSTLENRLGNNAKSYVEFLCENEGQDTASRIREARRTQDVKYHTHVMKNHTSSTTHHL